MRIPVLTAAAGASWEAVLVGAFEQGSQGIAVARRCVDLVDLLAVAASGQGRAALIAAELRRFDADAVDRLIAGDVIPIGVTAAADGAAEERLRAMGVEHVVAADAEPEAFAGTILQAVSLQAPTATQDDAHVRAERMFGDPLEPMSSTSADVESSVENPARPGAVSVREGSVAAVWGPTGAPGRSTIAICVADEIARLGSSSLLVDADVYGGTIAAMLGLLDESPGLAAACRLAGSARLGDESLASVCWQLRPQLRVLTGLPFAQRWPEIRPSAIAAVLGAARRLADLTVVDCGFALETDEEISFDSLAPRRNGATLAILDEADVILAVASADPIGIQRLVRGLSELREAQVTTPVRVILNKARRGVVPGDVPGELSAALTRFTGHVPAGVLPYDRDALDAALCRGQLLGEAKPSSALRKAIAELAASLVAVPAAARHRRRE